jgi:hypothetical protein
MDERFTPIRYAAARLHAGFAVNALAAGQSVPKPNGYLVAMADVYRYTVAWHDASVFRGAGQRVPHPSKARK